MLNGKLVRFVSALEVYTSDLIICFFNRYYHKLNPSLLDYNSGWQKYDLFARSYLGYGMTWLANDTSKFSLRGRLKMKKEMVLLKDCFIRKVLNNKQPSVAKRSVLWERL